MSISCEDKCARDQFFANLKCPNCFSAEVAVCKDEAADEATGECKLCDCRFSLNPELEKIGME